MLLQEAVDEDARVSAQFLVIVPGDAPPMVRWPSPRYVVTFLASLVLFLAMIATSACLLLWIMETSI